VPVTVLDQLMNLVGELVLARNQLLTQESTREDAQLTATSQRIHHLTAGLQDAVMKARMQPIDAIFSRLPRVARDAAQALGKQARLVTSGQDTELDKALLEAIKDPLTHVVRNAVDHGLEPPEGRTAAGKPAEGTVAVRAFQEGSQVVVEVEDDGRGVDVQRVRAKAVQNGLVAAEAAAQLADAEVYELLFRPGFSTAEKVTAISGRGVGMDVVRTNIERIGGTVQLLSRPGRGSLVRMRVPLTLVIVPALVVSSGGERYAIPQANLVELLRIPPEREGQLLADVHGTPILRLRGALLPVVDLAAALRTGAVVRAPDGGLSTVLLSAGGRRFALLVDDVLDTEDIVVKPLARRLEALGVYAGATVRGDGRVAMVLDVAGLARRTGLSGEAERHAEELAADLAGQARARYLLLRGADDGRLAFPLAQVSRVEELPAARVEPVGGGEAIQYRGGVLPLLRLSEALVERRRRPRGPRPSPGDTLHVVVRPWDGREIGIVVDDVLDVVESDAAVDPTGARPGVAGCALIQGRITEVLDPQVLLARTRPPLAREVTP
jgi:two-component system chemotaxis sensor kinase CheA